ncbi:SDR family oxidoreductase [Streptomyces griseocarneus]|uniref:SDR family oxidoreductase n=1 Tax=Streptomyces griseocarneus TaxID=51201 RepID=UPI00167EC526|nr:SDR family oxidoreductase [Streptomyces griseocarneus]MBZ6475223.1 SDR family oxidoreductase [Streptomyces griseocarneus]GHG61561.1 short-chain dehydrogenase [Streptomyces griseocarneus]
MSRSVVVTGASSGIGRATALRLVGAGYEVFATVRSEEKADELRARAEEEGARLRTMVLDVADGARCADVFADIAGLTGGGPWAVVNNAGTALPGAIEDVDEEQARRLMEVNLHAPARIARLVLPAMRHRGDGRIVNVSSVAARAVMPFAGWYSASKAGLSALTHALRMEAAPWGVRVVLVEPGFHASPMLENAADSFERRGSVSSRYADCYRAAARSLRNSSRYPGPERVAQAVHRVLVSPRPRARYALGTDARVGGRLDALVPYAVSDRVKSTATGLTPAAAGLEGLLARVSGVDRRP